MALNLRLPPALDADLRAAADRLGVSLNAYICVALDAYLRGAVQKPVESVYSAINGQSATDPQPRVSEPSKPVLKPSKGVKSGPPSLPVVPAQNLSRAERRRRARLERK